MRANAYLPVAIPFTPSLEPYLDNLLHTLVPFLTASHDHSNHDIAIEKCLDVLCFTFLMKMLLGMITGINDGYATKISRTSYSFV